MKLKMKQKRKPRQVSERLCGTGWEFEVTGSPRWVKRMVKEYVPKLQLLAQITNPK